MIDVVRLQVLPFELHNVFRFSFSSTSNVLLSSNCPPYSTVRASASSPGPYRKCGNIFIKQNIVIVSKPIQITLEFIVFSREKELFFLQVCEYVCVHAFYIRYRMTNTFCLMFAWPSVHVSKWRKDAQLRWLSAYQKPSIVDDALCYHSNWVQLTPAVGLYHFLPI